jgi:hypothetical protein
VNTQKITLATLHQATPQQVFDQVATHLLTQGSRSLGNEGRCAYRGINGLQCAAGCLIGDDEGPENLEGHGWTKLQYDGLVPSYHADLIRRLQVVHDACGVLRWRDELKDVADLHGLNLDAIDAVPA